MDPKALSGLDPKFRETYERIMGTSTQTPSAPSETPPAGQTPPINPMPADYLPTPASAAPDMPASTQAPPTSEPETIVITSPTPDMPLPTDPASVSPTEGIPFSTIPSPEAPPPADPTPAMPPVGETAFASAPEPTFSSTPPPPQPMINPLNAVDNSAGVAISSIGSINPTPPEIDTPTLADSLMNQAYSPAVAAVDTSSNQMVTPAPAYTAESLGIQPTMATAAPSAATGVSAPSPTLLKLLYIAGGIIFFILYTVFWIKVFKLPFIF